MNKEIWKTIELSKLCNNLIICSRNYYKQLKEVIKSKQVNNSEDMIKYSIMKGVLSTIKSKKDQICVSKHLDDAYLIICSKSFNHKKYFYGNPDTPKLNFYEITAIADWLMFKIIKLNNKNNDDPNEKKKKLSLKVNYISIHHGLKKGSVLCFDFGSYGSFLQSHAFHFLDHHFV